MKPHAFSDYSEQDAAIAAYVERVGAAVAPLFEAALEAHRIANTYDRDHPGYRYWMGLRWERMEEAHAARESMMRPIVHIYECRPITILVPR